MEGIKSKFAMKTKIKIIKRRFFFVLLLKIKSDLIYIFLFSFNLKSKKKVFQVEYMAKSGRREWERTINCFKLFKFK